MTAEMPPGVTPGHVHDPESFNSEVTAGEVQQTSEGARRVTVKAQSALAQQAWDTGVTSGDPYRKPSAVRKATSEESGANAVTHAHTLRDNIPWAMRRVTVVMFAFFSLHFSELLELKKMNR